MNLRSKWQADKRIHLEENKTSKISQHSKQMKTHSLKIMKFLEIRNSEIDYYALNRYQTLHSLAPVNTPSGCKTNESMSTYRFTSEKTLFIDQSISNGLVCNDIL